MKKSILALMLLIAAIATISAQLPVNLYGRAAVGENGVVAAAKPEASQVGIDILKKGGNAVDAAIATGFALGVLEANANGIGGGGFMIIKMVDMAEPVVIDFREKAPGKATPTMYLGPDGKSQVTVEYVNGKPGRVTSVVLASQHTEDVVDKKTDHLSDKARREIVEKVAKPVLKKYIDSSTKFYINQTGKFVIGGPQSDTGMTGRKIIVDTYGGTVPHGGGAFSGKDPTKVDRSAAYMCRYVAKNIVAAGIAEKCLIQLAYVIGYAEPLSVFVNTYGTSKLNESQIVKLIRENFELTPKGIIKSLNLLRPIYRKTAAYGHFGRPEPEFTWEATDKAEILKKAASKL